MQLGTGSNMPDKLYLPTDVTVASNVDAHYQGSQHTCIMQAGVLKCWGWNHVSQVWFELNCQRRSAESYLSARGS